MSKIEKMSQNAIRPVKMPNLNSPNQSMSGKHLSLQLGLTTTSSPSISAWTVAKSKLSKNLAKVNISELSVQDVRKVLSSSKISDLSPLSSTDYLNECGSTEQCLSYVTREVVDLALFTLHSVAKGEVEAYPSSLSSSSSTLKNTNTILRCPVELAFQNELSCFKNFKKNGFECRKTSQSAFWSMYMWEAS